MQACSRKVMVPSPMAGIRAPLASTICMVQILEHVSVVLRHSYRVMRRLVPRIHVFAAERKTLDAPAQHPAMTTERFDMTETCSNAAPWPYSAPQTQRAAPCQ